MRRLVTAISSFILAASAIGACSVDGDGTVIALAPVDASNPTTTDSAVSTDSAIVAHDAEAITDAYEEPLPPGACTVAPGACVDALPAGWTLTTYAASRATACATSYVATDVVSNPQPQAGACDCACNVSTAPVCNHGPLARKVSSDNTCGTDGVTLSVNGAGCTPWAADGTGGLRANSKSSPLAATDGVCTASPVANLADVTTANGRLCAPPSTCEEQLCNGSTPAPGGFGLCISKNDVEPSCPAGWGTTPVIVGSAATLSCSACTCDVNGPSTCTAATLDIYSDTSCATSVAHLDVDGNCDADPGVGHTPAAFKYAATLTQVCNTAGTKTPSVSLADTQSICCKP